MKIVSSYDTEIKQMNKIFLPTVAIYNSASTYDVEVFEKSGVLGGQINLASKITPKKEMHKWIDYLESECQRLQIPVHLNHEVKVSDVHDFDVVLVCNGSIPNRPNENACTAHDILGDKVDVHGNILVVGGGMVGVEASEYICEKHPDAHVTILEMKKNSL